MIKIDNEQQLLQLFRPIDRDEVVVPAGQSYPIVIRDYHSWVEPSGARAFLVFQEPDGRSAAGVVFRRQHPVGDPVNNMCEWCHSVRSHQTIGLLTAKASKNRRVGLNVCRDLNCKEHVRARPGVNDLRESITPDQKIFKITHKMSDFARANLF